MVTPLRRGLTKNFENVIVANLSHCVESLQEQAFRQSHHLRRRLDLGRDSRDLFIVDKRVREKSSVLEYPNMVQVQMVYV